MTKREIAVNYFIKEGWQEICYNSKKYRVLAKPGTESRIFLGKNGAIVDNEYHLPLEIAAKYTLKILANPETISWTKGLARIFRGFNKIY